MSVKPTRAQQMANEDSAEVARVWAKRCATLERELAEAQATIAALQWTEIAPDNLPKVGDEAYSAYDGDSLYVHSCDLGTAQEWTNKGWTHCRPISPPAQASATEKP